MCDIEGGRDTYVPVKSNIVPATKNNMFIKFKNWILKHFKCLKNILYYVIIVLILKNRRRVPTEFETPLGVPPFPVI